MPRASASDGRWSRFRFGLLTVVVLVAGLGTSTLAEAATKRIACALPYVVGQPNLFCTGINKILILK